MAEVPNLKNYIKRMAGGNSAPVDSGWLPILVGTGDGGYTVGDASMLGEYWTTPSNKDAFGIWQRRTGDVVWVRLLNIIATVDGPGMLIQSSDLVFPTSGNTATTVITSMTKMAVPEGDTFTQLLLSGGISTGNYSNVEQGDVLGAYSRPSQFSYPYEAPVSDS